jgi:DNA repair protein RadA/Sms
MASNPSAKVKTIYLCETCGGDSPKWQGQCPHCLSWNTLVESAANIAAPKRYQTWSGEQAQAHKVVRLNEVQAQAYAHVSTGIGELDRVLGQGIVQGSMTLIGGDPGIGKSTLLLQALGLMAHQGHDVLYVTGEESPEQIALRAQRLEVTAANIALLAEIQLETILNVLAQEKPKVAVIDSIQTIYTDKLSAAPGSVSQVRECAAQLTRFAKETGTSILLVGHVTKEGSIAGPRVLEHIVDAVLYFEGEAHGNLRMIRAIKNRFGAAGELGIFAMTEKGLKGVSNPSAIFLSSFRDDVPGACVLVSQEGTRPLLVEIQALVDDAHGMQVKRVAVGLEQNRIGLLIAVLHRHTGVACFNQDVFLNAVGGVKIAEPAADLAILMAMLSSFKNKALPPKLVIFGEVGLTGEIRPVTRGQERLREAVKLGFTHALIPEANAPKTPIKGLTTILVKTVQDAVHFVMPR